jgi:DNA-binding response OmpR family regulator
MPSVLLLLAEDEFAVADLLNTALSEAGYEVITARNGHAAIQEIEADAARFRAILTDIHLGTGPEGWEIARRARELIPTMPIIYMSGESAEDWAAKGVPGSMMVAKPFAPAQLVTAISNVINEADMHLPPTGGPS